MTGEGVGAATGKGGAAAAPIQSWTVHGDLEQFAPAWVAALGELEEVAHSKKVDAGPIHYGYAQLGDVLSHARTVLQAHDLALFQVAEVVNGDVAVSTTVMHTSGAYLTFAPFTLPAGNTAQNAGSAATYARRYSLLSILGLGTYDDDGASAGTRADKTPPPLMRPENVDRFLNAAHDSLLTVEEIGAVVLDATQGRTVDPHNVYSSERDALRDALHRHVHDDEGVSQDPGADDQYRPAPAESGGVSAPASSVAASPDQLAIEDTPDE